MFIVGLRIRAWDLGFIMGWGLDSLVSAAQGFGGIWRQRDYVFMSRLPIAFLVIFQAPGVISILTKS